MGGWANLTLVTDQDLGQIEPQATSVASPAPWGATTWASARAEAKRELKIWLELAFPAVPGIADRVIDIHAADWVLTSDDAGVSLVDRTSEANDDEEDDLTLSTIFATTDGRLYIGAAYQFEGLMVRLLASLNAATASVLTAKYWGPQGWTTLSATDGTAVSGRAFGQTGRVTWTIPSNWQPRTLNGTADEYFWVELSVSAGLSGETVKASQVLPVRAPDALKRIAAYLSLHFILNGLAMQAARPEGWEAKAKHYYDTAKALFIQLKESGGLPIDYNRDQKTTAAEIAETKPLRLGRA